VICTVQELNEVKWRPGQEKRLALPCSNLISFGVMYCIEESAYDIVAPRSDSALEELCPFPPLVTLLVMCSKNRKIYRK